MNAPAPTPANLNRPAALRDAATLQAAFAARAAPDLRAQILALTRAAPATLRPTARATQRAPHREGLLCPLPRAPARVA